MAKTVGDQSRRTLANRVIVVSVETSAWGDVLMAVSIPASIANDVRCSCNATPDEGIRDTFLLRSVGKHSVRARQRRACDADEE